MADRMLHHLHTWSHNLQHNLSDSVTRLTIQDYLRLVIIVGGYALLRPYLIQLGGRFQAKDHARELSAHESSSMAALSPNSLRAQVAVPEETDDDDDDKNEPDELDGRIQTRDADWGRRARRRQRDMIRKMMEAEERARQEEGDSDKEIEEFLEKDS